MKNFRLLPLLLVTVAILPLALFLWTTSSLLKKHIHPTVANDPQTGLSQSMNGLVGAHNRLVNGFFLNAVRLSGKDSLKKALAEPTPSTSKIKPLCEELVASTKASFFALTDKKGNVLYDNLNIPRPTPVAAPTPSTAAKKIKKSKTKIQIYASIKDWPGMDRALSGANVGGAFPYQGSLYQITMVPILSGEKNLGVILIGTLIDANFLRNLKFDAVNEVAVYSEALTLCTRSGTPPKIDYKTILNLAGHPEGRPKIEWNHETYLVDGLPLVSVELKPLGVIAVFQPIKQVLTVEGAPQKSIVKLGWLFLLGAILLGLGAFWQYMLPFNRLVEAMDRIKVGDFNVDLPVGRLDELGHMARSLQGMIEGFKDRDRISLVLGKVVSPQIAKNILEAKDLFALKGERRECTLLYADLRGFNTLSENMTPQALVEALNQYFGLINEIVFKHEGMLDRFIGDTAIAVWGAPFTHEDKELRAVKTALEIQEALKDFNISRIKKGSPPFTIGIGIHTGMVVAGNLGSEKHNDYTIIGDPLHIVARLCAMASPGQTVVSDETYLKIKPRVKANPLNPIAVKGSMESLKTYEITQLL